MNQSYKSTTFHVILTVVIALIFQLFPIFSSPLYAQKGTKTAIIVIDDLGQNFKGTAEIMKLPFPITVAVMPFLPKTRSDAKRAYAAGHEVIVHMPMEALSGKKQWLGPGAITTALSDEEIQNRVRAAIDNVPHAIGMNNHMGSKATIDARVMKNVLKVCKERGIFFLDSLTNSRSIVGRVADEVQVPSIKNHIFLDHACTRAVIHKQFIRMREHLRHHDVCIAIGHVGAECKITATILKEQMEKMSREHIQFKTLSSILKTRNPLN